MVSILILHPPEPFRPEGNDSSCVLRVDTIHGSMLLTGDIEARGEAALIARDDRADTAILDTDVVIVPHHGSLTSSGAGFVERTAAELAIVSAGHNNRWGFPRPEVSARWQDSGAALEVTGARGAVDLRFASGAISVDFGREKVRRYWRSD